MSAGKESKNGEESEDFLDDQESSQTDERQAEPVFCSLGEFGKRLSRKTQGERKGTNTQPHLRRLLTWHGLLPQTPRSSAASSSSSHNTKPAYVSVAIPHDAKADILRDHERVNSQSSETESEAPGHAEDYRRMEDEGKGKRKGNY